MLVTKKLLITCISLFLLANTSYFWLWRLGGYSLILDLVFWLTWFILLLVLFIQLVKNIKKGLLHKDKTQVTSVSIILLGLIAWKPTGIIEFHSLGKDYLLIAGQEGVANCTTSLSLRSDKTFRKIDICFGKSEIRDKYEVRGDTINFRDDTWQLGDDDFYKFAIINKQENAITLYQDLGDTTGYSISIVKNKLFE